MRCVDFSLLCAVALVTGGTPEPPKAAFDSIDSVELRARIVQLASGSMEGRDTPSAGLDAAAAQIERALRDAGYQGAGKEGAFRLDYTHDALAPDAARCALEWKGDVALPPTGAPQTGARAGEADADADADEDEFRLGVDYVPYPNQSGSAEGELVFLGFGIESKKEPYDDLRGDVAERIAVILEGEPRHTRMFDGPEVTPEADLHSKLVVLEREKVAGVIVVRRGVEQDGVDKKDLAKTARPVLERLSFRATFAQFPGETPRQPLEVALPVIEVTAGTAARLCGEDIAALGAKIDANGKPLRRDYKGRRARIASASSKQTVRLENVAATLKGSDAKLSGEYVVLGAHFDHIGVDARGRIGFGADDNASGTAALLEIAAALAKKPPRRSVLVCAFSGEEDGLLGSRALCAAPPVAKDALVAMLNLDMIGRGDVDELAALGTKQTPSFEKLLERARTKATGIKKIVTGQGDELWQRSDHYSFHQIGVPTLFFFEGLPIDRNKDYHTWRDTLDLLDYEKIERTAKLGYSVLWLLGNDDERPPRPQPEERK
ncbi:MAG: M28 family peptidase [Planctomycetota bacterium]|nr:MAG: M28 family peptidase [Planctomycetota bacterium]